MGKAAFKRTTLEDVATRAGVSLATVSVAITGKSTGSIRVSAAVAERIRRTARELGYRPNMQARGLSMRRTHTIAILVNRSTWHNAMFFLAAAQRVLRALGYCEIFLMHDDDSLAGERRHLEMCLERQVEGVIILPLIDLSGGTNAALINELCQTQRIPVVQLGIEIPGCAAPAVVTDEAGGFSAAVKRLHEMGHRRIAHVTMRGYENPSALNPYRHAHLRYRGYKQAMAELGLPEQVACLPRQETRTEQEFEDAIGVAKTMVHEGDLPTAIVAYSDFEAVGLLAGLVESGLKVPQDVSIIGYGNQQFGRMARPAVSTIAPAYEQLGQQATQTLLRANPCAPGASAQIAPSLLMRSSMAKAGGGVG